MDALRTARHFPIVYINAHPLVGVRHYAEAFEKVHRLLQVVFEVGTLHRFHKAQIEVALIMVNRPATGKSACQQDIILVYILLIHFLPHTLMLSYHHRRDGLPHHKEVVLLFLQEIFFCRQIEIHIRTAVIDTEHHAKSVS